MPALKEYDKRVIDAECHKCHWHWTYTGNRDFSNCPHCATTVTFYPLFVRSASVQNENKK
jgi:predicted Zn-ribbon and HTH transcriptional regulator